MKKWASVFLFSAIIGLQSSSCIYDNPYTSDHVRILPSSHIPPPVLSSPDAGNFKEHRIFVDLQTTHKNFSACKNFFDDERLLLAKEAKLRLAQNWRLLSREIKIISGYTMRHLLIATFRCKVSEDESYEYLAGQMFVTPRGGAVYLFLDMFYTFMPVLGKNGTLDMTHVHSVMPNVSEAVFMKTFFHEVCHTLDASFFSHPVFPEWYRAFLPEWRKILIKEPKQLSYSPEPYEEWAERCGHTIATEYALTDATQTQALRFEIAEQFTYAYPKSHAFFKKLLAKIIEHHLPNDPIPELVMEKTGQATPR